MRAFSVTMAVAVLANVFTAQALYSGEKKELALEQESSPYENQYIVHLESYEDHDPVMEKLKALSNSQTTIHKVNKKTHKGASNVIVLEGYEFEELNHIKGVKRVSRNGIVHIFGDDIPTITELYGLDRIDQLDLPLDQEDFETYRTGQGVDIYVVDTGVDFLHREFEQVQGRCTNIRRMENIFNAHGGNLGSGTNTDDNGHGTHCAGTAGGNNVGVARCSNIFGVKVLNSGGSGSWADVLLGLDEVLSRHLSTSNAKSVVSMSLGGSCGGDCSGSDLYNKVQDMVAAGIVVSVAAGNSNDDASNYIPAAAPDALTIGASNSNDGRASFSNYGTVVDMYAPGVDIWSACAASVSSSECGNGRGYIDYSGTSMACPHVSGVVALNLERITIPMVNSDAVNKIRESLWCQRSQNKIADVPAGTNDLLQVPNAPDSCVFWLSDGPTFMPTGPSDTPTKMPTFRPTAIPTRTPTWSPSFEPTGPSYAPTTQPTHFAFPYYNAADTNSALRNTVNESITVCPGAKYAFSICATGMCAGDTYLRLYDAENNEVALNDDYCGLCSTLEHEFFLPCQEYNLHQGCWGSGSCGGQVSVEVIVEGPTPPTLAPTVSTESPSMEPIEAGIECKAIAKYNSNKKYSKNTVVKFNGEVYKSTTGFDNPTKWVHEGPCLPSPCDGYNNWRASNTYKALDEVVYKEALYEAKKRSKGKKPNKFVGAWRWKDEC